MARNKVKKEGKGISNAIAWLRARRTIKFKETSESQVYSARLDQAQEGKGTSRKDTKQCQEIRILHKGKLKVTCSGMHLLLY